MWRFTLISCWFYFDTGNYALLITALRPRLRAVSIWLRPIETARLSKRESYIISKRQFWHLLSKARACRIRLPAACHSLKRMTTCREPNGLSRRCKSSFQKEGNIHFEGIVICHIEKRVLGGDIRLWTEVSTWLHLRFWKDHHLRFTVRILLHSRGQ